MFQSTLELHYSPVSSHAERSSKRLVGWYFPDPTRASVHRWIEDLSRSLGEQFHRDCRLYALTTHAKTSIPSSDSGNGEIYVCLPRVDAKPALFSQSVIDSIEQQNKASRTILQLEPIRGDVCSGSSPITVWAPAGSVVSPSCDANQWQEILSKLSERQYVWLPSLGIVPLSQLKCIDWFDVLLLPADEMGAKWRKPEQPPKIAEHIRVLAMAEMPSLDDLMRQEKDSIGKGSPEDLKALLNEPTPQTGSRPNGAKTRDWILSKLGGWFHRQSAKRREALEKRRREALSDPKNLPAGSAKSGTGAASNSQAAAGGVAGGSSSWLNPFGLSLSLYQSLSKMLESQRQEQLERLLKLFEGDPDKALRMALPIGSHESQGLFRGLATPGASLVPQNPSFSLGGMQSAAGGPVDFWSMPMSMRAKLEKAYREQANKEIAAGRIRRAAYIHAQLLGDLYTAARILEDGKYFLEAAIVYRDKLKRNPDAARCLLAASQFREAAKLYLTLNQFLDAAQAFELGGDPEAAREAYEAAVAQWMQRNDSVSAAKIIKEKLNDQPRAEELLWKQWPGHDAVPAMRYVFEWLAAEGRHREALYRFEEIVPYNLDTHLSISATICSHLAHHYPEPSLRTLAEDRCRLLASRLIRSENQPTGRSRISKLGTEALTGLAATNQPLQRDVQRFHAMSAPKAPAALPAAPRPVSFETSSKSKRLLLEQTYNLIAQDFGEAYDFTLIHQEILVTAGVGDVLRVGRLKWSDQPSIRFVDVCPMELFDVMQLKIFVASTQPCSIDLLLEEGGYTPATSSLAFPNASPWRIAVKPSEPGTLYATFGGSGVCRLTQSSSGDVVFIEEDSVTSSYVLPDASGITKEQDLVEGIYPSDDSSDFQQEKSDSDRSDTPHLLPIGRGAVLLKGNTICYLDRQQGMVVATYRGSLIHATSSYPNTRPRVLLATDRGMSVVYLDSVEAGVQLVCDRTYTRVAFSQFARVVGVSDGDLRFFEPRGSDSQWRLIAQTPLQRKNEPVFALLPIAADRVLVCYATGIDEYRLA